MARDLLTPSLSWMQRAACLGHNPSLWYPPPGSDGDRAKRVCQTCPVRQACLEYALQTDERYGVWGGHASHERSGSRARRDLQRRGTRTERTYRSEIRGSNLAP